MKCCLESVNARIMGSEVFYELLTSAGCDDLTSSRLHAILGFALGLAGLIFACLLLRLLKTAFYADLGFLGFKCRDLMLVQT